MYDHGLMATAPALSSIGRMRRWVVFAYPLLLVAAIRSVHQNDEGLRVLWPAVVMLLPAVLLPRRPLLTLLLMLAGATAVVAVLGPGDVMFGPRIAVVVAVGAVAASRPTRIGMGAALTAWITLVLGEMIPRLAYGHGPLPDRIATSAGSIMAMFPALLITIGLTVGLLVRQRREHAGALRARAAEQAIAGERLRIARELHDSVAHSIGIIALQAGAASRVFDTQPARARQAIGVVETASREALAELRRMLVGLRDPEDTVVTGLADLPKLTSVTAEAGVRVDLRRLASPVALPPEIDRSAYRIIQEAVTNVVRHAGVDSCSVVVEHIEGALTVEVVDDGQGCAGPPRGGHGLVGMRERVALLHGDFSAGPRDGGGFRVAARLPMPAVAA